MSEPESLATDEALSEHIRRHSYDRLLMLSDGIFAIAITLAALEIQAPPQHVSLAVMAHAMARPGIENAINAGSRTARTKRLKSARTAGSAAPASAWRRASG